MKLFKEPAPQTWNELACRPTTSAPDLSEQVAEILNQVKQGGDQAVRDLTWKLDGCNLEELRTPTSDFSDQVSAPLRTAIRRAFDNIRRFHLSQVETVTRIETHGGIHCWRESRPIDPVGLYIPGGTAPLFSSLLMLGIPARIAGCSNITVCTPPGQNGSISPVIKYVAEMLGISHVHRVGGAQAIAAMAYGTESIPRVNKIFGPGNAWVTRAKQLVQNDGIAIDMPAGPSEVLVIADRNANPDFIAADLLSQAEHGPDSQVMLATDDEQIATLVMNSIHRQLGDLPRKAIAEQALSASKAVVFSSIEKAIEFSNLYAPEHLILNVSSPDKLIPLVQSAGSVFVGHWSCESLGDYASGTNHTLPTAGFARSYSGVSVDSFVKKITFQEVRSDGLASLGPHVIAMAEAEGLDAHARAVSIRLKSMDK